jgi:rhamnulose-1-phosphate aldolase
MSIEAPYPSLDEIIQSVGEAGIRLSEINACEGAAGNISVCFSWPCDPCGTFPLHEKIELPLAVPGLAGYSLVISGSGCRLREILQDPLANLGFLVVDPGGKTGELYASPRRLYTRLTSELNSHLAIHEDQVLTSGTNYSALVHAQPIHMTYLSHIAAYQDERVINHHLLRWQPEAIVNLPDGIGVAPFCVPGSPELMAQTKEKLKKTVVVIWSKHGLMARSDVSVKRAVDRIDYVETAAHYEYLNLANHSAAEGLSEAEILRISNGLGIQQSVF